MRLTTTLVLLLLAGAFFACKKEKIQFDPKEKSARAEGNLVVFCSNKGQVLAPMAAAIFNQKIAIFGDVPYYATFRSTNAYDPEIKTIPEYHQKKIESFGLELSGPYINPLLDSDISSSMSLIHIGAKPLNHKEDPRINEWRIPDQIADLQSRKELLNMMVDNLIQTLRETE